MTRNLAKVLLDSPIPAVFINYDEFEIHSGIHGNKTFRKKVPFDVGKTYHLMIQQVIQNRKTIYAIEVNGNKVFSYENFAPMTCDTVKVTVSDPSYKAFTSEYGILSNFKYSRGKYRLFKRKF